MSDNDQFVCFPLLADPRHYRAHTVDMVHDAHARDYWIGVFEHHLPSLYRHIQVSGGGTDEARRQADQFQDKFGSALKRVREQPDAFGELSILRLCHLREQVLAEAGVRDPYYYIKHRENEQALAALPALLQHLDAVPDGQRLELLVRGVFAGNLFDLGAKSTTKLYEEGAFDYETTRQQIPPRPWLIDDFDSLQSRWRAGPHRKAILFVDNAGADVVLGMIPMAREMLRRGTRIVLTANTHPSLNDITHAELVPLVERIAGFEPTIAAALREGRLQLIASGNDAPLIDLRRVSRELATACDGVDLVLIEGMGRAIETNLNDRLTCDSLKLAMVKEQHLAELLGGELYDVVCKYDPRTDSRRRKPAAPRASARGY